jgi:hypothetical protein
MAQWTHGGQLLNPECVVSTEPPAVEPSLSELPFRLHSFILKVWLEDTQGETGPLLWRGHITHIGSAAGQYVKSVEEVVRFIQAQLKQC